MNENFLAVVDMVREYIKASGQEPTEELYERLVKEEVKEFGEAEPCTGEELKEAADVVYTFAGLFLVRNDPDPFWENFFSLFELYCHKRNLRVYEAVERVHKNNMDRMYQDDGTILRRDDGKIIKNPNTPKVKLEDLV